MSQPPRFPKGLSSIRAHVLTVLLESKDMTGCESIFSHRKATLSTVIRALIRKYHWPIERQDFPSNTADGRASWATVYCLPQEAIDAAFEAGARDWLDGVRAARSARSGVSPILAQRRATESNGLLRAAGTDSPGPIAE